jgi:hypothetical protein
MSLRLDLRTLSLALRVARRLASGDQRQEGLALLRELLASLVDSKQFLDAIPLLVFPESPSLVTESILALSQKLPGIARTLAASGYATEAVRVMATGAGLAPALQSQLVETGHAVSEPSSRAALVTVGAAARELTGIGMDILKAGKPEGIILLGAAHRVSPDVELPIQYIRANIRNLPQREKVRIGAKDAQLLTNAAYDLRYSGRVEPAVRVGTGIPAMLSESTSRQLFKRLEPAKPGSEAAFQASYEMLHKGYVAEAANLLIDSGATSPAELWTALDKEVIDPSPEITTPKRLNFYVRRGLSLVTPDPVVAPDFSLETEAGGGGDVPPESRGVPKPDQPWQEPKVVPIADQTSTDGGNSFPPNPVFYFALEGEGARCDQVLWGAIFDLVFHYDALPDNALAEIKGSKLQELLKKKTKVSITVESDTLNLISDELWASTYFEGGKMTGPQPRFSFSMPQKESGSAKKTYGVTVNFFANKALLYRFFLEIKPVDKLDEMPAKGCKRTIDLDHEDLIRSEAEPRDAVISIQGGGGEWLIYFNIDEERSPALPARIGPAELDSQYGALGIIADVTRVANNPVWKQIGPDFKIPDNPGLKDAVLDCTRTLMTTGSKLYEILSADEVFKDVFERIEKLKDGAKITILTNGVAFPWELLYPVHYNSQYDPNKNYHPEKFWGRRFQIEQLLYGTKESDKLPSRRTQPDKFYVSMGLNEDIDNDWKAYPLLPVKFQKEYCDKSLVPRGEHLEGQRNILRILNEAYSASFIYFFCHGDENHLQFEKTELPLDAHSLSPIPYPGWPLVFLNACSVGNISALSFTSFRTRFRDKKAAGLVAPAFPIPTLFAAVFGKAVIEEYAKRCPIGQVLFDLRGQLLDQGNALGLLYSLQCPLDVRAPV